MRFEAIFFLQIRLNSITNKVGSKNERITELIVEGEKWFWQAVYRKECLLSK
jgi:hypothetical protein